MIFNNNYDRILWLILKNDNINRERILEFIENIPSDFLIKLQNTIKEYEEYKLNKSIYKKNKYFCGEIYDGSDYLYHFSIDNDTDSLFVGRNTFKYGKMFNDFGLLLTNGIDVRNMNDFCEYMIGKISYNYNIINDGIKTIQGGFSKIDYKLIDVLIGNIMVISDDKKKMFGDRMKFVSIDDSPKDYGINDLNKLIRKRNMRKENI